MLHFDLDNERKHFIALFCASCGSGKSYLIKYLLYELLKKGYFNDGIIICPLEDEYEPWVNEKYLYKLYSDNILINIMNEKDEIKKKKRRFIIFDDCLGSVNWNKSVILKFLTTYRHHNCSVFISTQYINRIPTHVREIASKIFIFNQNIFRSIKAVQESFFPDKKVEEVQKILSEHCKGYRFIYYDVRKQNKIVTQAPGPGIYNPNWKLSN